MTVVLKIFLFVISLMALSTAINVEEAFKNSEIVPNCFEKAPTSEARVRFSDGSEANLGNYLKVISTVCQPNITWPADPDVYYTLLMFDPDVPSLPPKQQVYIHWLIINIKGGDLTTGKTIIEYTSSIPVLPGTHRYTQLLYQQNAWIADCDLQTKIPTGDIASYEEKYSLQGPVAGNFTGNF